MNPTLFDAAQAREEAISRVDAHADPDWRERAYEVLTAVAARGVPFTADDVWDELGQYGESTHEPAALGPVFLKASRARLIRKTNRLVPTRHPRRHRDLTEWITL